MTFLGRTLSPILLVAGLSAVALALESAEFGLGYLLKYEARSIGQPWARHIEARLPDLFNIDPERGSLDPKHFPEPEQLARTVADVLVVADVYQIDFINGDCYCSVTLGSYENSVRGGSITDVTFQEVRLENDHPHSFDAQVADPSAGVAAPKKGRIKHVFRQHGGKSHAPGHATRESQFPIDVARLATLRQVESDSIILHESAEESAPTVFAELYHKIYSNGELVYIVRLLINMEQHREKYIALLVIAFVIGVVIIIVSFSYPAGKYWRALRAHRAAASRARYLAGHDSLTDLVNRRGFQESAAHILQSAVDNDRTCGLVLIDVNKFKEINDNLGHHVGDEVLKCVACHLTAIAPSGSLVARLGGDEFAVLVADIGSHGKEWAENLSFTTSPSTNLDGGAQHMAIALSAGMACYPDDAFSLTELLIHADLALYASKHSGRPFTSYDSAMGDKFRARALLLKEFRAGLEASQIEPYYQPIVSLETGQVVSLEALARWHHPDQGTLSAAAFYAVMEDREICEAVGQEMLRKVTRDAGCWKKSGVPYSAVSINIERADLMRPGFELDVSAQLGENGLCWQDLILEVTENCIFEKDSSTILDKVHTLAANGCLIALDDFGTGYSSITHIKKLPCRAVKIDKSFIKRVVEDEIDQAIVRSLIELGRTIKFRLVAEGVETEAQRDLLNGLGCHLAQGFLYSRPVAAKDVPNLIAQINGEMPTEASVA